jgi:hypothetical protein
MEEILEYAMERKNSTGPAQIHRRFGRKGHHEHGRNRVDPAVEGKARRG